MTAFANNSGAIPISKPFLWGAELKYVEETIRSGELSGNSPVVRAFETRFAAAVGRQYGVSAANGTAALQLALTALSLPQGSEVLVPAYCMMSPVFAALACGLKVIPIDIDDTWNMEPVKAESAITPRTSAIIVVHNYGHCSDMIAFEKLAVKYGLSLVEDAAEAHGASVNGREAGTFGDISCFSLYANKTITTGEGGMAVTDAHDLVEKLRILRNLSFGLTPEGQYEHSSVGVNYRLGALQAAFGMGQLEHAASAVEAKRKIGLLYRECLQDERRFTLQAERENAVHAYWAIAGVLDETMARRRGGIQTRMGEKGIETRRFFSPVHRHSHLSANIISASASSSSAAEKIYEAGICLPSFIGMKDQEVVRVCEAFTATLSEFD